MPPASMSAKRIAREVQDVKKELPSGFVATPSDNMYEWSAQIGVYSCNRTVRCAFPDSTMLLCRRTREFLRSTETPFTENAIY